MGLISRALAERLKKVLPSLISKNQTAYVKARFISEGGRLIYSLVKVIPSSVILELDKIKKHFIWKNGNPKIKQEPFVKIMKMVV